MYAFNFIAMILAVTAFDSIKADAESRVVFVNVPDSASIPAWIAGTDAVFQFRWARDPEENDDFRITLDAWNHFKKHLAIRTINGPDANHFFTATVGIPSDMDSGKYTLKFESKILGRDYAELDGVRVLDSSHIPTTTTSASSRSSTTSSTSVAANATSTATTVSSTPVVSTSAPCTSSTPVVSTTTPCASSTPIVSPTISATYGNHTSSYGNDNSTMIISNNTISSNSYASTIYSTMVVTTSTPVPTPATGNGNGNYGNLNDRYSVVPLSSTDAVTSTDTLTQTPNPSATPMPVTGNYGSSIDLSIAAPSSPTPAAQSGMPIMKCRARQ